MIKYIYVYYPAHRFRHVVQRNGGIRFLEIKIPGEKYYFLFDAVNYADPGDHHTHSVVYYVCEYI